MNSTQITAFREKIYAYFKHHGRTLPWRRGNQEGSTSPFEIFVSEVMLQQTQVSRVLKKFPEYIQEFPNFPTLAHATTKRLLQAWSGLGYNRRALYLRNAAQIIVEKFNCVLPDSPEILDALPGIGHTTAASIVVFAFNKPAVFIETNIRTVYIHEFFINVQSVSDKEILPLVEKTLDRKNPRVWFWALMDYGTMIKNTTPNPNRRSIHYKKQSPFKDSNRRIRGLVIRHLLAYDFATFNTLSDSLQSNPNKLHTILDDLVSEKIISVNGNKYSLDRH